jgi:hypothetical protein
LPVLLEVGLEALLLDLRQALAHRFDLLLALAAAEQAAKATTLCHGLLVSRLQLALTLELGDVVGGRLAERASRAQGTGQQQGKPTTDALGLPSHLNLLDWHDTGPLPQILGIDPGDSAAG